MNTILIRAFIVLWLLFALSAAKAQTAKQIFSNSGIWQDYGTPVSAQTYPEFKGRLVNVSWSDIETAPNTWNWAIFDTDVSQHIADSMPIIILVYTGMNAPAWIYSNGVPKVMETDSQGNQSTYSPYYLDSDYNVYFKRMITNVQAHIKNYPPSTRNKIIAMQGCYGSTGDQISYKGAVANQYAISDIQFDSLFKAYSLYYYNTYKDLTPAIKLLSNPVYTDSTQVTWLQANCPDSWIKCGTFAKGSQLNYQLDEVSWLYDIINKPSNGQYTHMRSEITGPQLSSGWWTKNSYKEMFGIMCSNIFWGLDWPNETPQMIVDSNYDSTFAFFNKYAGQKVAALATNAMCALKDALDASDSIRFPSSTYGATQRLNISRYQNIRNAYAGYGAKLEDTSVISGSEFICLNASGTNDVGWHLLPGNYERFLHQINANVTSAGYWNVDSSHNTTMYGRFARGFDVANNKNGLYFNVEDNFFANTPLNAAYPVTIAVTYFDNGTGSWQLFYDGKTNTNAASVKITCANTKTWKKTIVTLTDARFGNGSVNGSDFYIKNMGTQNVIFSVVELSRQAPSDTGFAVTSINSFDTVCINSVIPPQSFSLNGGYLNNNNVQVGPLKGYSFSSTATGSYKDSLIFSNYNQALNEIIFVRLNTNLTGTFVGNIPVTGGGVTSKYVAAKGTVLNTSPALNAAMSTVSCNNNKDGIIDLQPSGGTGPFSYKWTNSIQQFWSATTQDIDSLQPANYTVVVNSFTGCSISKTFTITQPDKLVAVVTLDSLMICKNTSTTVTVTATGGTMSYTGTGSLVQYSGFKSYTVSDAHGCTAPQGITVQNGTVSAPAKPVINGPTSVANLQTNIVYSISAPVSGYTYTWTIPTDAAIVSGQYTTSITVNWGSTTGNVTATATNNCGISTAASKKVNVSASLASNNTSNNAAAFATASADNNRQMVLMPNPVSTTATIKFYADTNFAFDMLVINLNGSVLSARKGVASTGFNYEKLSVENYAAGTYFVTIINNNTGERSTVKMIKQ